jgi:hypothetical protein
MSEDAALLKQVPFERFESGRTGSNRARAAGMSRVAAYVGLWGLNMRPGITTPRPPVTRFDSFFAGRNYEDCSGVLAAYTTDSPTRLQRATAKDRGIIRQKVRTHDSARATLPARCDAVLSRSERQILSVRSRYI